VTAIAAGSGARAGSVACVGIAGEASTEAADTDGEEAEIGAEGGNSLGGSDAAGVIDSARRYCRSSGSGGSGACALEAGERGGTDSTGSADGSATAGAAGGGKTDGGVEAADAGLTTEGKRGCSFALPRTVDGADTGVAVDGATRGAVTGSRPGAPSSIDDGGERGSAWNTSRNGGP
jgi:hypothetical protein